MALTNGQIVGICVGVILFVVFCICVPLYCYLVWKKRRREGGFESEENGQPSTGPPPHSEKKGTENPGYEIGDEVNGAVNHGKRPDNGVVQTNGPVAVDVVENPAKIEIETPQKSVSEKPDEISLDIPEESNESPDVRRDSVESFSRFSLNSDVDLDNISLKMRGLGDTDDILTSVMSVKSPFNFDDENVNKDPEVTPEVKGESNRMFDFDNFMKDPKLSTNEKVPEVKPEHSNVPEDRSKMYQVSDIPGNDLAPRENLSFDLERSDSLSLSSASSKETIIEMPGYAQKDMAPQLEQNVLQGNANYREELITVGNTTYGEELTLSDLEEGLNSMEIEQPAMETTEPQEVEQLVLQTAQISQAEVEVEPEEEQVEETTVEPEVKIQIEKAAEVDKPDDVILNGHDVEPMTLGVEMISDSDSGSDVPTCSISMAAEDSSSTDASAGENDGTVSVKIPERTSVTDEKVNHIPERTSVTDEKVDDSNTFLSFDKTPPTIMGDSFQKSIFSTLDSSVPTLETPPSLNEEPEVTTLSFRSKDGVDDDSVSISSASSGSSVGSKGDVLKESLAVEEPHSPPFSPITPLRKRFFSDTPETGGVPASQVTSSPLPDGRQLEPETGEAKAITDTEPPWKSFDLSPTSKKEMNAELETVTKIDEVSSQVAIETPAMSPTSKKKMSSELETVTTVDEVASQVTIEIPPEPDVSKIDEQFEEKALTFAKPDENRAVAESVSSESSSSESERPNVDSDTPEQDVSIETPLQTEKVKDEPATPQKQEEPTVVQESKTFESILDRPSVDTKAPEPRAESPSVGIGGDPTDDVVSSVGSALTSWRTRKPWRTRAIGRFDDDSSSGRSTPESEKTKDASFFSSLLGPTKEDATKGTRSDSRTPRFKYKGLRRSYEDGEEDDRKGDIFSSPTANVEGNIAAKTDIEETSVSKQIEEKLSEPSDNTPRKTFNGPSANTTAQEEQALETPPRRKIDDIVQHINNRSDKQQTEADQSPRPEPEPAAKESPSRPPLPSPDHLTASQRQLAQQESASSSAPGRPPLPSTPNLNRTESYKALTPEQQSEIISAKSTPTSRTPEGEVQESTPKLPEATPKVPEATPKVADTTPKGIDTTPKIPDTTPRIPDTTAPKVPDVTPKVTEETPNVPETTPKVHETTPKVPDSTPKVPNSTPKAKETRTLPGRTRDKPTVSKLSPARLSPYTPMPFSRERHTSPTSVSATSPSAGVAKGRRPRGVARFMNSSSNPLFHAAMLLNDEENKKNASPPAQQKKNENGSLRNGRSSSPSVKTSPAPHEQSSKPSTTTKTESEDVKPPPRKSRGSNPSMNGTSASAVPYDGRKDSALLRTPSTVSRASEDGSEYGEAVSVALDDAFAMLDDI